MSVQVAVGGFNGQHFGTAVLHLPPVKSRTEFMRLLMAGDEMLENMWHRGIVDAINTCRPKRGLHVDVLIPPDPVTPPDFVKANSVLTRMWAQTSEEARWLLVHAAVQPPLAKIELLASVTTWETRRARCVAKLEQFVSRGGITFDAADFCQFFPDVQLHQFSEAPVALAAIKKRLQKESGASPVL